ncbi:pseudouridine synthase [Thozetella sp. PMI_491]|nr:pseudouridine synthase [Thozetella sp. PMI_491]
MESNVPPPKNMADHDAPSNTPAKSTAATAGTAPEPNAERNGGAKKFDKNRNRNKGRSGGQGKGPRRELTEQREAAAERRAEKRRRVIDTQNEGESFMSIQFSKEEIAAEERKPKRKVAVLIGYAGTGYHGMQINHKEKTIEGDLFSAFVKAGAIAKTNADDPKKSSFIRCARTDKGVHAAGNVISLKLIIEEEDIVDKINEHLPEQIRVWGIQRTANSFSSYQACDSRWYEYLMPSYALLPPHPGSFLGKKIVELGKEKGTLDEYLGRLEDVKDFWKDVRETDIQPLLDQLDPDVRKEVEKALNQSQEVDDKGEGGADPAEGNPKDSRNMKIDTPIAIPENSIKQEAEEAAKDVPEQGEGKLEGSGQRELSPVEKAVRDIKAALVAAKRRYRVTPARLEKLQTALNAYVGTNNFHNYTVDKTFKDPSAKRHIKSFVLNTTPIPIRDTEWLSLKVHGQSFMMHQIRKMVAMAVMVTRCGAPVDLISESYGARRISIPKAPGLGLMLERPVFDEYNRKQTTVLGKDAIDFGKYEAQIQEFKDREIYKRMFESEERENAFYNFFHQIDNFRTDFFLWVTPGGLEASYQRLGKGEAGKEKIPKALEAELGDDKDGVEE